MWIVALNRLRLGLRDGWFLASWSAGALMAAAALWVAWDSYEERVDLFDASLVSRQVRVEQAGTYAQLELAVERPPTPLSLLSRGVGEDLGSRAAIRGRYGDVAFSRRDRPVAVAARRSTVDTAWVLALVLGFVGVFLAHDSINAQRESGTLKQALARGLPRSSLLAGEFVGSAMAVLLPCGLMLLAFAAWAAVVGLAIEGSQWLRIACFFGLAALYGCCWVAISLALSVFCRRAETSLVLGVLAWAVSIGLYPQVAGWTAAQLAPAPPLEQAFGAVAERVTDRDRAAARRNAFSAEHRRFRRLAAALPTTAFLDAGAILAGTSATDHETFLRQVDNLERAFLSWQSGKLARYPERERRIVQGQPLDLAGFPEAVYRPPPITESLLRAGMPAAAMLLGAVAALLCALWGIQRLDAR